MELDFFEKQLLVPQIYTAPRQSSHSFKGFRSKKTPPSRRKIGKFYTPFKTQDPNQRRLCLMYYIPIIDYYWN